MEALLVALVVTAGVTAISALAPDRFVATGVAATFLAATWVTVWRLDDARVVRSGLTLGGLVLPGRIDPRALVRGAAGALGWAALFALVTFPPFVVGWRLYFHAGGSFAFRGTALDVLNDVAGQLVIIALPEEAFYRGYLQSRLDDAMPPRLRVLGAQVGPSLLVTSAIFALGHLLTIHQPGRLAVFFPSLVFGWLRARTGGIGAGVVYHAACNILSETLAHGFGLR